MADIDLPFTIDLGDDVICTIDSVPGIREEWMVLANGECIGCVRADDGYYNTFFENYFNAYAVPISLEGLHDAAQKLARQANLIPCSDGHYAVEHLRLMDYSGPVTWVEAVRNYNRAPRLPHVLHPARAISRRQMHAIVDYCRSAFGPEKQPHEGRDDTRWYQPEGTCLLGFREVTDVTLFLLEWQGKPVPRSKRRF